MLKTKRNLIISIVSVAILAGCALIYFLVIEDKPAENATPLQGAEQQINLAPATPDEQALADDNKTKIVEQEQKTNQENTSTPSGKKAVKPILTYAGQYGLAVEAGAYVSSVFEDGGTCTAVFTQSGKTLTRKVTAVKGANSVDCPVMAATSADFSQKGTWSVIVSYESSTATGSSDSRNIEIK